MPVPPHRSERIALCDLFTRVGPTAPTLCEGWTTTDLATHLVVRERRPLAALGLVLPPFGTTLRKAMAGTAARHAYDGLVTLVRHGPPVPLRPFDSAMNLSEYFIHHEDVRRGAGDTAPRPAADVADLEESLWRSLGRGSRRALGPVGLDLIHPDGRVAHVRRGDPTATLSGRPGEIVLYLSGRQSAAHVELGGPSEAVAALGDARFGI
jgi:uncharacterized protein (TIGR03085 family)